MGIFNFLKKTSEHDNDTARKPPKQKGLFHSQEKMPIGVEEINKAKEILERYRQGKNVLDLKTIENENFWKQRQYECYQKPDGNNFIPASAWLWNCIVNKHAQLIEAYPSFNIIPRQEDDAEEAEVLSTILPVVLRQAGYQKTFSQTSRYKVIQGTGITGIFWDPTASGGLGEIVIKKADLLNLFWEPGITDIQDSPHFFALSLMDTEALKKMYPDHADEFSRGSDTLAHYDYDDNVDTSKKSLVIEWYYKISVEGKPTVQYCKFVDNVVLYATENETEPIVSSDGVLTHQPLSKTGLYADAEYPYEFDPLFEIEGTPAGYGYTDIGKDAQIQIDALNNAITQNAILACQPRFLYREDLGINLEMYADTKEQFVPVYGDLNERVIKQIEVNPLPGSYVTVLRDRINELKETLGNRDVNTGGAVSGVTAASAIAALQEAGGRVDRATAISTYYAQERICRKVINRIEQFYTTERYFRILDDKGDAKFVTYRTKVDTSGFPKLPFFDIDITAEKAAPYKAISQNELMLQLYGARFFDPANALPAKACLQGMDFDGKDKVIGVIDSNNAMLQQMMKLAAIVDKDHGTNIVEQISVNPGSQISVPSKKSPNEEPKHVQKAREKTQEAGQP